MCGAARASADGSWVNVGVPALCGWRKHWKWGHALAAPCEQLGFTWPGLAQEQAIPTLKAMRNGVEPLQRGCVPLM